MAADFQYDVFLSHSAKDKPAVRELAARLQRDGVRVWLDEEQIKPGDSIPAKIEDGLEHSRVLVLCMSAHAFGSDWAQLEAGTFRFRDPLNRERRFIPLRLDDAPIKGSLAQFLYINWRPADREQEYVKLLEAFHSSATKQDLIDVQPLEKMVKVDHKASINVYAFSQDGKRILFGGVAQVVVLCDLETEPYLHTIHAQGNQVRTIAWSEDQRRALVASGTVVAVLVLGQKMKGPRRLHGHAGAVNCVMWGSDNVHAFSGSDDRTVRVWNVESGRCLHVLQGHSNCVSCLALSGDSRRALSGSLDNTIRSWDVETGHCVRSIQTPKGGISCLALSGDSRRALSGSFDNTIRLWDVELGLCLRVLEGHTGIIRSVAWSPKHQLAISGSADKTVRLWDTDTGRCLHVLKGHDGEVKSTRWSADGRRAFSGDSNGGICVWDLSQIVTEGRAPEPLPVISSFEVSTSWSWPALPQVQYTNAKVLLVGESGVGKTGISNYLARGIKVEDDKPLPSTDGAWATHWPLKHDKMEAGVEREIWLWDFAGQVDYRLVHQLFMDDTAAAVLVFNPQNENPFEGLGYWDCDLQKGARKQFAKLLAAGRVDRGGLVVSAASMERFMKERGFLGPLQVTSAKTGEGCDQLREAIVKAIDWNNIPQTTSPALYHRLKQEILNLRDSGLILIRLAELKQRMEMTLRGESFELAELEAVVGLLAGPGMIQRLDFGGFILLRPEVLSRYAAAVVRKVRKHPQELGCIREDELMDGDLDYQDFKRLPREDEAVVLRTLLGTFVSRAWCLRQPCDGSAMLTFPSYFRRERKEQPSHPSVLVTYRFDGPADDIYATLVVRLHHTVAFQSTELWKSAADFKTQTGTKLGFTLMRESEGTSLLEVYFEPDVDGNSRVLFLRYVHDHLTEHGRNVVRLRHYSCGNKKCDSHEKQFTNQAMIDKALALGGKGKVFCPDCGKPILLRDAIEEKFESPRVKEEVREMQNEAQVVIDNESRELILVGQAFTIVAEAGQIYRGYTNSDHGIDGEVEFKDDQGRASGQRLYVQLKSGDSYLKKAAGLSGKEVFQIKNPRWADYWQQQAYAVMLVIRTSDGEIRWMDVSAYLKRESAGGKTVKQIVFTGERFDAVSVQHWRKKVLETKQTP